MATASICSSLLNDAADYLAGLAKGGVELAAAQERLQELRARHPRFQFRLLWQREAYDGSLQYDLLIRGFTGGTVSLAFCADDALPWPLRGGQRQSERLLLRVNGDPMDVDEAICCLDFLWDEAALTDRLVTSCLLRQELEEHPVRLSDEELQRAQDAFRRARGLLDVAATREWMSRRCLSQRDLEELVAGEAAVARLRKTVTVSQIPAYFAENQHQLDLVRIVGWLYSSRADAQSDVEEIQSGRNFYSVMERSFANGRLAASTGLFRTMRRDELHPGLADRLGNTAPGTIVGPISTEDGHAVIRVVAVERAVLDEATAEVIERRLFAAWLEKRKRSARVEWFWGNAARTDPRTSTRTP